MADTTNTISQAMLVQQAKANAFASGLAIIGCVGMVMWAANKGKKGKFWWGLGGFLGGGAVGRTIDYFRNNK